MRLSRFAALVFLIAAACSDSAGLGSTTGVTLTLVLSTTNLRRADADTITMTVRNNGPRGVTLTGGVCEPRAQVVNGSGEIVVPPGGQAPCVLVLRRLELAPGEKLVRSFVWNTSSLPAGTYRVSATFTSEEVQLATAPVTIELN